MNNTALELLAMNASYNVMNAAYSGGADPTGTNDSTDAIQAAIDALPASGGPVFFPPGTYKISSALSVPSGTRLLGSGANTTEINQTSSSAHGIQGSVTTGLYEIIIAGLTVNGPGASPTDYSAVYMDAASGNVENLRITNCRLQYFGSEGLYLNGGINSYLSGVIAQHTGNNAFSVLNGTSVTMEACYARSQAGIGYFLDGTAYSALIGCACDFGEIGYELEGVYGVKLAGCGCEAQTTGGYKIEGASEAVELSACYNLNNPGYAFWVTGDSLNIVMTACIEKSPGDGATASIQVDSGSTAVVIAPTTVTATAYNGTVNAITP